MPTQEIGLEDLLVDNYSSIGQFDRDSLIVEALPSGFPTFDENRVIKKGRAQLVTVAAYTSHGKSAILTQIAAEVAKSGPVFLHSFEMAKEELETRLLAGIANWSAKKIMDGNIPTARLEMARREYSSRQLYLCKDPNSSITFVQTSAFEKAKAIGQRPALIVVDYVQLMTGPIDRQSRTREIGDIMTGLRSLAVQLDCPILIGAQMNRECEHRGKTIQLKKGLGDYQPILSDIAESSTIAHDSDVVLFLTRQEQYDRTRAGEADISCLKNRSGNTFESLFDWSGELCTFYDRKRTRNHSLEGDAL